MPQSQYQALKHSLQNITKKYPQDELLLQISMQCQLLIRNYQQIQEAYSDNATRLQSTMLDFSQELEKHKKDRQQLFLLTKQRAALMDKANNHAEASLQILKENELLEQTVTKLHEISNTQAEKIRVLEEALRKEIENAKVLGQPLSDAQVNVEYRRIAEEYGQMVNRNNQFQEQLLLISEDITNTRDNLHALSTALAAGILINQDLKEIAKQRLMNIWPAIKKVSKNELLEQLINTFPEKEETVRKLLGATPQQTPFADW